MILTSTLSIFDSFPAAYHSYGVHISELVSMHDAAHIMISDIATSVWVIDVCHKATQPCGLRIPFKTFPGRYQDLVEKYQRSVKEMVNDSFPG